MKKLIVIAFVLFSTNAIADVSKVTDWFQKEWNTTVEFQKESWSEAKAQNQKNKLYIQDLFNKVKNYVSQN